jgi:hypothetical protein
MTVLLLMVHVVRAWMAIYIYIYDDEYNHILLLYMFKRKFIWWVTLRQEKIETQEQQNIGIVALLQKGKDEQQVLCNPGNFSL